VAAVAHANAHGSTHYVGDGDPLPSDLNEGVRLVGPGAPAVPGPEVPLTRAEVGKLIDERVGAVAAPDPGQGPDLTPPGNSPVSSDPGDYAASTILVLRDVCRERGLSPAGAKADLVMRLTEHDRQAVA
jgi:hypothetical protein